ncbi:hypothetical protein [Candidatus Vidania fulgoroideorum]
MINTKQKNLFLKEIRKYINNRSGYYIDLTYGKGGISKMISNIINKNGKLFAYEFNKQFKLHIKLKERRNVFFYKKCFTSIKRLKLERKISCSIIDIGITENELINNYNPIALHSFGPCSAIREIINFSSASLLEKRISSLGCNKEKRQFIRKIIKNRRAKPIIQGVQEGTRSYKFTEKTLTYLSYIGNTTKIEDVLYYITRITEKLSYIIILCFNSKELKTVNQFYRRNKQEFYYCKTVTKKINLKSFTSMKVIKKR